MVPGSGADQGGANDSVVPRGRPIPGAFNDALTTELPVPSTYDFFDFSGDHTWVWNCFYRGTVAGALPAGCEAPTAAPEWGETGYAYSRQGAATANRPTPAFFGADQNHTYQVGTNTFASTTLANANGTPNAAELTARNLTAGAVTHSRSAPAWERLDIVNGDFEFGTGANNTVPGWSHHGGGGDGTVETLGDGNRVLQLDSLGIGAGRTHNLLYVPPGAFRLRFDLRNQEDGASRPTTSFFRACRSTT